MDILYITTIIANIYINAYMMTIPYKILTKINQVIYKLFENYISIYF